MMMAIYTILHSIKLTRKAEEQGFPAPHCIILDAMRLPSWVSTLRILMIVHQGPTKQGQAAALPILWRANARGTVADQGVHPPGV